MTLTTTAATVTALGNSATTLWPFAFIIPTEDDVEVSVTLLSDGTTTVLTNGVDYEGVGEHPWGQPDGGYILYPVAGDPLGPGNSITISRIVPITQETDLDNQGTLYPSVIEDEFDYLTMIDQQLQAQLDRSFLAPPGQDFPDGSWAAWLAIIDGATPDVQASDIFYASQPIAEGTEIPGTVQFIETAGGNDVGDGGGQQYWRSAVSLGTYNEFQSADGAWWEPNTGNSNQAFWSAWATGAGNPTRDQPVYVNNSRNRWFLGAMAGTDPSRVAGGSANGGWGWLDANTDGPRYLARDAQFGIMNDGVDAVMIFAGIFADDSHDPSTNADSIAIAAYAKMARESSATWAHYVEVQQMPTAVPGASAVWGMEMDVRNASGSSLSSTPYVRTAGAGGLVITGPGDQTYGPVSTNPANFALDIHGSNTSLAGFNSGIMIDRYAINGTNGADGANGVGPASAIQMSRGHSIRWYDGGQRETFYILGKNESTDPINGMEISGGTITFRGQGGNQIFAVTQTGTIATSLSVAARATGVAPALASAGSDADIDVKFEPKGAGLVRYGIHTGSADAPVSGYITIKDSGGTTRKLAVIT